MLREDTRPFSFLYFQGRGVPGCANGLLLHLYSGISHVLPEIKLSLLCVRQVYYPLNYLSDLVHLIFHGLIRLDIKCFSLKLHLNCHKGKIMNSNNKNRFLISLHPGKQLLNVSPICMEKGDGWHSWH